MAQQQQEQPNGPPMVFGVNCRLVGELFLEGSAIVLGQVEGQIEVTDTLEIGEGGSVKGIIRAGALFVHGRVEGEVHCADEMHLGATANLVGDVCAAAFSAEEGASCRGQMVIGQQAAAKSAAAIPGEPTPSAGRGGAEGETDNDNEAHVAPIIGRVDQHAEVTSVSTSPNAAKALLRRRPSLLSGTHRGAAG